MLQALAAFGDRVGMAQTYGQAEAPATIAVLSERDHRAALAGRAELLGSVGRPYSYTDVMIVDEAGTECAPDETGEVAVRSPMVATWRWLDGRVQPLRPPGHDHRTGDLGHFLPGGYLHLDGRRNEMLISGGYNVYPAEVERVLVAHELVEEACVVGVPDREWGDRVNAVLVLKRDAADGDLESILDHCRHHLARYKVPKELRITDVLPVTAAGKVSRRDARRIHFDAPA